MDNGHAKKRRGRPPGANKGTSSAAPIQSAHERSLSQENPELFGQVDEAANGGLASDARQTPFSSFLRSTLQRDRGEIARVARDLDVAENTIYRWMNGSSDHPRPVHLKRLPEVLPEYRTQLINVINQTFGGIFSSELLGTREVPKDMYVRILEINAANDDEEARFWQISQAIFDHALQHLDPELMGLAITYAKLMPPREDGIHSLLELSIRGHSPWPELFDSKAYLGSTTLAGAAIMTQRLQIWSSTDNNSRILVEIDENEHSACAVPVIRGAHVAGVLIVSSTQPDFFRDPVHSQAVNEYALLLNIGLNSRDFYPFSLLSMRPMPTLKWQREQIAQFYADRIITYARKHATSRRESEFYVQRELEMEFEEVARAEVEQRHARIEK